MQPYAMWTDDCQGKKDFDGPLLSVSTRYWPGPGGGAAMLVHVGPEGGKIDDLPYGSKPTAHSCIILNVGPREERDGGGDSLTWSEKEFEADTEAEVKAQVEAWVTAEMKKIVSMLGGESAFKDRYLKGDL